MTIKKFKLGLKVKDTCKLLEKYRSYSSDKSKIIKITPKVAVGSDSHYLYLILISDIDYSVEIMVLSCDNLFNNFLLVSSSLPTYVCDTYLETILTKFRLFNRRELAKLKIETYNLKFDNNGWEEVISNLRLIDSIINQEIKNIIPSSTTFSKRLSYKLQHKIDPYNKQEKEGN